jgi:small subunit ribosomal protein S6
LELRKYETIYLLHPTLSTDQSKKVNEKIFNIIKEDEGKLLHVESWGIRKTAYPVRKQGKGNFFQITFAGKPGVIGKLERSFRITEEIMKFHSLKIADTVEQEELEQDVVFAEKSREDDGRRDRKDRRRSDRSEGGGKDWNRSESHNRAPARGENEKSQELKATNESKEEKKEEKKEETEEKAE